MRQIPATVPLAEAVMIKVTHEPAEFKGVLRENCFRCGDPTPFWYTPKDVPCCGICAEALYPDDVPSKADYLKANRLKTRPERDYV